MLELVLPSELFSDSFLEAERELGRGTSAADLAALWPRFADARAGVGLAPGHVPSTTYWLVDGCAYLGRITIRHALTDALRMVGGHIGYDVRPSQRRRGLGQHMLELALPKARALGIDRALITCDAANTASRTIIERCGGVLESRTDGKLRFWVEAIRAQV